jgi:hypothetical protein
MAKESMKARERKEKNLLPGMLPKRAELKAKGDWEGCKSFLRMLLR